MHLDTPDDLVHSVFSEALYGDHPLGREVLGSERSITEMTRDQVHGYYQAALRPGEPRGRRRRQRRPRHVVATSPTALAGWAAPRETDVSIGLHPRWRPSRARLSCAAADRAGHVVLGGPGLPAATSGGSPPACSTRPSVGGMASRLFQEVRERHGLVYSVYSYQGMHVDTGTVRASTRAPRPRKAPKVLDVLTAELDRAPARPGSPTPSSSGPRAPGRQHPARAGGHRQPDGPDRQGRWSTDTPLLNLDETHRGGRGGHRRRRPRARAELLAGPFTLAVVGPVDDPTSRARPVRTARLDRPRP
jgi:hypothetical protein